MPDTPPDLPVLEARHIQRNFGAVVALADASVSLRPGEVLGLVGDNGAGKSTLLKILSGVIAPTGGEILIDGREIRMRRAQDALEAGIETVYQDLALVDTMSAYQNVYLGREARARNPLARFFDVVDDREMRRKSREVLDALSVKTPRSTCRSKACRAANGNVLPLRGPCSGAGGSSSSTSRPRRSGCANRARCSTSSATSSGTTSR
jgi:ABC-type sugar transport system ATPase subunit